MWRLCFAWKQVRQARAALPAQKPAEPVPSAYDIIWQVGEPMLPDQAMGPPARAHRLTWQSEADGLHPQRMHIGRVQMWNRRTDVYPAREALRCVAWLQAAVRGSRPGSAIRLHTRGVLSFPQLQESPGARPSNILDACSVFMTQPLWSCSLYLQYSSCALLHELSLFGKHRSKLLGDRIVFSLASQTAKQGCYNPIQDLLKTTRLRTL